MPESGTYGSVRGAVGNNRPYRERRPRTISKSSGPFTDANEGPNPRRGCVPGTAKLFVYISMRWSEKYRSPVAGRVTVTGPFPKSTKAEE